LGWVGWGAAVSGACGGKGGDSCARRRFDRSMARASMAFILANKGSVPVLVLVLLASAWAAGLVGSGFNGVVS